MIAWAKSVYAKMVHRKSIEDLRKELLTARAALHQAHELKSELLIRERFAKCEKIERKIEDMR